MNHLHSTAAVIEKRPARGDRGAIVAAARRVITVCHPVWRLGRGGLERQLVEVIRRLPAERFRHVVLVRGCDSDHLLAGSPIASHVTLLQEPLRTKDRLWSFRLSSILSAHAVDVLHVRGVRMLPDAALAARLAGGVRTAFSFHGFEWPLEGFGRWRRRLYRAAAEHCNARWAVSGSAAGAIAGALGMRADQFGVLSNGVDSSYFQPSADGSDPRRALGLPADRPVLLCVGNLKPIKGQDVLLAAARLLADQGRKFTLVFVGRDETAGAMQAWADEHLTGVDVRFAGPQRDVLRWHQAADLFVLPSHSEGMSNALLEAMACGAAAVVSAAGGNREAIEHGVTGVLVRPNAPAELAAALGWLMEDAAARRAMGRAARRAVQARFAIESTAERHAERYASLAGMRS